MVPFLDKDYCFFQILIRLLSLREPQAHNLKSNIYNIKQQKAIILANIYYYVNNQGNRVEQRKFKGREETNLRKQIGETVPREKQKDRGSK